MISTWASAGIFLGGRFCLKVGGIKSPKRILKPIKSPHNPGNTPMLYLQSLVPGACKQVIKSKAGEIKFCKEKNYFPP